MKILIATDSFKDALPALEVCEAIARGVQLVSEKIEVQIFPLGDGGEGTAEVLTWHNQGTWESTKVYDPLHRKIKAHYGLSKDKRTAFIEMAQASGLQLLKEEERDVLRTSTFGTGELILDAVNNGAERIILGIGGSATNDMGIGMAGALGFKFKNQNQNGALLNGQMLKEIVEIDGSKVLDLSGIEFKVLCDVDNPLFGPQGAAHVYARQKGADDQAIELLEEGVRSFAKVLEKHFGKVVASVSGAGAAGGLGAGAMAFLDAELLSGIDFVLDETNFDAALQDADLVITGEGKIDAQTLHGKLINGIAKRAQRYDVPVIAFCGTLLASPEDIKKIGLQSAFSILDRPMELREALVRTVECLQRTSFQVISTMKLKT